MLWTCVIEFINSWDEYLPLMEFAYNNSYHSSIGMEPHETLDSRKCRTQVCWDKKEERKLLDSEIVQITADQIKLIRERLKTAQDRQKSYAEPKHRDVFLVWVIRYFLKSLLKKVYYGLKNEES